MKKIWRILLALVSVEFTVAFSLQAQTSFDNKYLQPAYQFQTLDVAPDGSIYGAGIMYGNIIIAKFDSIGNVAWYKELNDPGYRLYLDDLIYNPNTNQSILAGFIDGGVTATYRQALIIAIDSAGALVYSKVYGDTNQFLEATSLVLDSGGFAADILNESLGPESKIVKFSNSGILLQDVGLNINIGFSHIFKMPFGGYLLADALYDGVTRLFSVDSQLSNPVFNNNGFCMPIQMGASYNFKIIDSNLYLIGTQFGATISLIDQNNLSIIWTRVFTTDSTINCNMKLMDMQKLSDGSFIILGYFYVCNTASPINYCLIHTTPSFDVIHSVIKKDTLYDEPIEGNTRMQIKNDKVYFCASKPGIIGAPGVSFELIKTDSSFSSICNSSDTLINSYFSFQYCDSFSIISPAVTPDTLIVDSIILSIINYTPAFGSCTDSTLSIPNIINQIVSIYPNPFSSVISISPGNQSVKRACFIIRDIIGTTLFYSSIKNQESQIDLGFLPKGIYLLEMILDDERIVRKIVKE